MAWNVFKLCTGLRIVGSVMILVVLAIVSLSYYAVVIATYLPRLMLPSSSLQDIVFSLLILALFHSLVSHHHTSLFCFLILQLFGHPHLDLWFFPFALLLLFRSTLRFQLFCQFSGSVLHELLDQGN